ncbi:hypothetical protein SCMU_28320 [Sinomonas cyclohexanicum]|uniref:Uncharacterized protein n=1 Tax=Sinomonas cyclohexanicum TaxID=322009 RepID=A0ABM7PXY4_SINCY|nr:hypothetical protein SCMU_28320 [Corynebacterium cyclohexanicum]
MRNTSTPPETRPSHTWYSTTSATATALSPWISGRKTRPPAIVLCPKATTRPLSLTPLPVPPSIPPRQSVRIL